MLCTASPAEFAGAVANHLGLFSTVLASSPEVNLAAADKAQALTERYGQGQFDYVGNTDHDLAVFAECAMASGVLDNAAMAGLAVAPRATVDSRPAHKNLAQGHAIPSVGKDA